MRAETMNISEKLLILIQTKPQQNEKNQQLFYRLDIDKFQKNSFWSRACSFLVNKIGIKPRMIHAKGLDTGSGICDRECPVCFFQRELRHVR